MFYIVLCLEQYLDIALWYSQLLQVPGPVVRLRHHTCTPTKWNTALVCNPQALPSCCMWLLYSYIILFHTGCVDYNIILLLGSTYLYVTCTIIHTSTTWNSPQEVTNECMQLHIITYYFLPGINGGHKS